LAEPINSLDRLREAIMEKKLGRRDVLKRGMALGLSAPVIAGLLAACGDEEDTTPATGATATPGAGAGQMTPAATEDAGEDEDEPTATAGTGTDTTTPTPGTGGADPTATTPTGGDTGERGGQGEVRLLYWQAPVILNVHLANGTKDYHASRVVLEPLADFDADLNPILFLATEYPSEENGTLAPDRTWVEWRLREGVKWHDGEDFNAEDVVFTYEYITNEENATTTLGRYNAVTEVEMIDEYTVRVHYAEPNPAWFDPFTTTEGCILPEHIYRDYQGEESRNAPANLHMIGTGPFMVREFRPGDVCYYDLFPDYWDPGKPHIDSIEMKGGGDSAGAARAVLESGEYDWAWNLQIEPAVLNQMLAAGLGTVDALPGGGTERLMLNFTDPNVEVDGERSHISTSHPLFGDVRGRRAISVSCQRDVIAEQLYGPGGVAASNQYDEPAKFTHPEITWKYDLDEARALLDEMGYPGGMTLVYQTSINSVRQKTQEIIKQSLEQLGIGVEIKAVDAAVYFSTDQGNPDTAGKFYADMEMHTNGATIYPARWFERYRTDQIAQKENGWARSNYFRYSNPEFDAMHDQVREEVDEDEQVRLFRDMLWLVTVEDVVEVPLVNRTSLAAKSNRIQNYTGSPWAANPIHDLKNWTLDG
jgi:peptide/nickel transport system substrate-binding protein